MLEERDGTFSDKQGHLWFLQTSFIKIWATIFQPIKLYFRIVLTIFFMSIQWHKKKKKMFFKMTSFVFHRRRNVISVTKFREHFNFWGELFFLNTQELKYTKNTQPERHDISKPCIRSGSEWRQRISRASLYLLTNQLTERCDDCYGDKII